MYIHCYSGKHKKNHFEGNSLKLPQNFNSPQFQHPTPHNIYEGNSVLTVRLWATTPISYDWYRMFQHCFIRDVIYNKSQNKPCWLVITTIANCRIGRHHQSFKGRTAVSNGVIAEGWRFSIAKEMDGIESPEAGQGDALKIFTRCHTNLWQLIREERRWFQTNGSSCESIHVHREFSFSNSLLNCTYNILFCNL